MKNLIKSVVLVSLCAFLFVSCEKEGQYLPKKKISRITTSTASTLWGVTTTAVTGYQDLEWSGKLLSKITLRDGDGDVYGAVVPQYDNKKRVTSLHCVTGDDIDDFKFTYDGKDLMKITRYSNDKDAVTEYSFRKDGKNVVEITVQGYSSKALDYAGINPLQFVLPWFWNRIKAKRGNRFSENVSNRASVPEHCHCRKKRRRFETKTAFLSAKYFS